MHPFSIIVIIICHRYVEYSVLYYTGGPCCFSILIQKLTSANPNLPLHSPHVPLATPSLSSVSAVLFLSQDRSGQHVLNLTKMMPIRHLCFGCLVLQQPWVLSCCWNGILSFFTLLSIFYEYHTSSLGPFLCWWTRMLFPCFSYCEWCYSQHRRYGSHIYMCFGTLCVLSQYES